MSSAAPPPVPTEALAAAAAAGRMLLPTCPSCGRAHWYPRPYCPHCRAGAWAWQEVDGRGTIHTWTVPRRDFTGAPDPGPPVPVVLVVLDHGPPDVHLVGRLGAGDAAVGAPVVLAAATPHHRGPGGTTLEFRLRPGEGGR